MKGAMHWTVVVILCILAFVVGVIVLNFIPGLLEDIHALILGGGESGKIKGAKALFVRIDPEDEPVEIWAFHLTDENRKYSDTHGKPAYFQIDEDNFSLPQCIIYQVDEQPGWFDIKYIFYITPGAIIQEGCTNIRECISGHIAYSGCTQTYDANKFCKDCLYEPDCDTADYGYGHPFTVINENFINSGSNKCSEDRGHCPPQGCCYLLQAPDKYKIRYGLICSDEGKWEPCTEALEPPVTAAGIQYVCEWDENKGYGKWKLNTEMVPTISLSELVVKIGKETNCPIGGVETYKITNGAFVYYSCEGLDCTKVRELNVISISVSGKQISASEDGLYFQNILWCPSEPPMPPPYICYWMKPKIDTEEKGISEACLPIDFSGEIKTGDIIQIEKGTDKIIIRKLD
jgi:hypothetical protein